MTRTYKFYSDTNRQQFEWALQNAWATYRTEGDKVIVDEDGWDARAVEFGGEIVHAR